nr:transporter substrate-binding domain-containing protein [uncultured Dethiosulfovibrio sp.]
MVKKLSLVVAVILAQVLFASSLHAKEVVVYGLEAMPLCGVVDGKPVGVTVEILQEATNHGAPEFTFKMDVPWLRAQMMVQEEGGELNGIIPFSRSPQREDSFKWVGELIQTQFRLYSFERPAPVNSVDEAKELSIGVVRGHAIIPLLERLGITKLDLAPNAGVNAQKLRANRIAAVADSDFIALYNWKNLGEDTSKLQEGLAIGDATRVYFAAGLHFPDDVAQSIADALENMRSNGKMDEILSRWR